MTKLYVVSKSDLDKLARGRSSSNRSFALLDGEELDLDELAGGHSSSHRSFAVLDGEELYLDERAKRASGPSSMHLSFAMLYLGLFIGFLITTIAVDMSTNKHTVFIVGTILFGAVSLWLWIWWWFATKQCIPRERIQKWPTYEDAVQID